MHSLLVNDHSTSFRVDSSLFLSFLSTLANRLPCLIGLTNVIRQIHRLSRRMEETLQGETTMMKTVSCARSSRRSVKVWQLISGYLLRVHLSISFDSWG